jgi:uncharacterized protein
MAVTSPKVGTAPADRQGTKIRMLSADSHICEPPNLWTEYIEPGFRERAPRIVQDPVRGDIWKIEGLSLPNIAAMGGIGKTSEEMPLKVDFERDVRRAGYDPDARLVDMDASGVDAQVLFPTVGFHLYGLADPDFLRACFTAWNNWVRDFCKGKEDRLRGIAFLAVDDVQWAVREMKRCREMGLVAANIPLAPTDPAYSHPYFEPLWSAAEELEMPLTIHVGSNRGAEAMARQPHAFAERFIPLDARPWNFFVGTGIASPGVPRLMNELILSGIVERHPKLRVIPTEFEAGWAGFWVERLDETLVNERSKMGSLRKWDLKPSELFRRNFALTFIDDKSAIVNRELIGVDNIMWSDDFPHIDGVWTNNNQYVFNRFFNECEVSDEDKRKLLGGNMARIFKCFTA